MNNQFFGHWGMVQDRQAMAAAMLEYFPSTLSKSGHPMPSINPFFRDGLYEARAFYDETEFIVKKRTYENFAEDWAYLFGAGLMHFCGKETSLVIGHDIREGSNYLHPFALKGSQDCGIQTIDAGLCTGPELSYLTNKHGWAFLNGTASHYRRRGFLGFKNGWPWGKPLYNQMRMTQIIEMAKDGKFNRTQQEGWQPKRLPIKTIDATKEYVDACWKGFEPNSLGKFKIAIDAFSSGGTKMYEKMFEGTQITTLDVRDFGKNPIVVNNAGGMISNPYWGFSNSYFIPYDPFYYNRPDPLIVQETWQARETVLQHNCDLAVIADHDADRMGILDENGEWLSASIIDCLVYEQLAFELGSLKDITVFGDVRLSRVVKELVTRLNGKMIIGEVGRPIVIDLFQTEKIDFGSEGSLHHNSKRMNGNEDPLYFLFMILKLMNRTGFKLSKLAAKYNKYFNSGEFYILIRNDEDLAKYREWERITRKKEAKFLTNTELSCGINVEYPNSYRWGMRESYSETLCKGFVESFVSRKHGVKVLNDILDSLADFGLYPFNPFMNENDIQRLMAKNPISPETSIGEVMFMGI